MSQIKGWLHEVAKFLHVFKRNLPLSLSSEKMQGLFKHSLLLFSIRFPKVPLPQMPSKWFRRKIQIFRTVGHWIRFLQVTLLNTEGELSYWYSCSSCKEWKLRWKSMQAKEKNPPMYWSINQLSFSLVIPLQASIVGFVGDHGIEQNRRVHF